MNNREDIEKYYIELYRKTKNCSFEKFVETVFHYNVRIGDYNKPISFDLKNEVVNILKEEKLEIEPDIKYWNYRSWSNTFIIFDKLFKYYNRIILDFPIFDYDLSVACPPIIKFILYNNITAKISVHNVIKNTIFKVEVYDIEDANKIIDFFGTNNKISNIVKSRVIPFLIQKNLVGIYKEYDPFDFINYYIKNLYEYFSLCIEEKEVTISKFTNYINKVYRFEKKDNERRMLRFLSDYLYMYEDTPRYERLFSTIPNMNLNGLDLNDYLFKCDQKDNLFFISKKDNTIITYGSEIYFSLIYTKFHDDYIKIQDAKKYYNDFNGIYDNILSNNFKNVDIILDLIKYVNAGIIYKKMYIIASGYYAYKRLGIPFDIIKKITDRILFKLKELNTDNN